MSIEAMKMALDALEKLWDIIDDIDTYSDMAKADDKLYRSLVERRQSNRFKETGISTDGYTLDGGAIAALRQAIEQAEKQERVDAVNISQERVDETVKGEHEPAVWMIQYKDRHEFVWGSKPEFSGGTVLGIEPLYTAPPRHEWVGLTDEEIYDYADKFLYQHGSNFGIKSFGKAIEAKLKEKNSV